jgi:hypothetical protein
LKHKVSQQARDQNQKVEYMASMLPTANSMHKFLKCMKRDEVFERPDGYKIVTQIRTNKDKERLEYLLNFKLSA